VSYDRLRVVSCNRPRAAFSNSIICCATSMRCYYHTFFRTNGLIFKCSSSIMTGSIYNNLRVFIIIYYNLRLVCKGCFHYYNVPLVLTVNVVFLCCLVFVVCLLLPLFNPEHRSDRFLRNVKWLATDFIALLVHSIKDKSSIIMVYENNCFFEMRYHEVW
jgi:hypothetical protein